MYCTKAWWETEEGANRELARIRGKRMPNQWKLPTRSYLCACGFWHLTSSPQRAAASR